MSRMTGTIPSTLSELEIYARKQVSKECNMWLSDKPPEHVKPILLEKTDHENFIEWKNERNSEFEEWLGTFKERTEVDEWIKQEQKTYIQNLQLETEQIPGKYLAYMLKKATDGVDAYKSDPLKLPTEVEHYLEIFFENLKDLQKYWKDDLSWDIVNWIRIKDGSKVISLDKPAEIIKDFLDFADNYKTDGNKLSESKSFKPTWKKLKTYIKIFEDQKKANEAKDLYENESKPDAKGRYKYKDPNKGRCNLNLFNKRKFEYDQDPTDDQIRLMHWNILADGLAGSLISLSRGYKKSVEKQFASPKECLSWNYRKWLILEEIAHYKPDIITLVELDEKYADGKDDESLIWWLRDLGYATDYKSKKTGGILQGTGLFWKEAKLTKQGDVVWKNFDDGGQIFGLIRFELKSKAKLAVCALHLASDKTTEGEKTRANQIWNALYWLKGEDYKLNEIWEGMNVDKDIVNKLPPWEALTNMKGYDIIIAGDFNAERKLSYDEKGNLVQPVAMGLPYLAGFKSLYDEVHGRDLAWTSWKKRPAGRTDKYTIDYIFGSERITGLSVLEEVEDGVDEDILLPNWDYPSDHLSLVVDFKLGGNTEKESWFTLCTPKHFGKIVLGIAVVVITVLLWKYRGPGKRRSRSHTSSDTLKNN